MSWCQKGRQRMILAQSLAAARAQRTPRVLPDGRTIWVSQVFPVSGATPEMPVASFVEQSGAEGLETLLLQFPVAEASAVQPGTRSQTRGRAHGGAGAGHAGIPRSSGGRGTPAMADPEHVALVQQGATAIAAWRDAHPGERLHLAQADLAGVNLRGANLHGARLSGVILEDR